MDKGTKRSEAAERRGREEAGDTHRNRRNMVALGQGERWGWSGPRPALRPTQVGVGPWWKPFGSQEAGVKGMGESKRLGWVQGRMGDSGVGTAGYGSYGSFGLPPGPKSILKFLGSTALGPRS